MGDDARGGSSGSAEPLELVDVTALSLRDLLAEDTVLRTALRRILTERECGTDVVAGHSQNVAATP